MDLPTLPFDRPGMLELAPKMLQLQESLPVARVRTPTGDEAWLVTRYEDVKALLADPRLGRTHPKPDEAARVSESALLGGPAGAPVRGPPDAADAGPGRGDDGRTAGRPGRRAATGRPARGGVVPVAGAG